VVSDRADPMIPLLLLLSVIVAPVHEPGAPLPWSFAGHRVVCEIAFQELDTDVRAEVLRLTRAFNEYRTFAESCVWADTREAKDVYNSHWVNTQAGDDEITMADCPADCIIRHLETETVRLADGTGGDADRARSLMFVAHFVGDIHQPLHIAYASDRGGNTHEITNASGSANLHSVWDGFFIRDRARDWRQYGQALHDDVHAIDRTLWADASALAWANETFRIVEDYVYEGLGSGGERLGSTYEVANLPTIERQLKKAGVRLGAMLNELLGTP
jgi:hypothetical protein